MTDKKQSTASSFMFELSHQDRLRILYRLKESSAKLTRISRDLDINTVEASRHLSRLSEVSLVEKTADGTYQITYLTPFVLKILDRVNFILEEKDFFLEHDIGSVPIVSENCFPIAETKIVRDFFNVVTAIKEGSTDAQSFLYIVSPKPMKDMVDINIRKADEGVEVRIIYLEGE